MEPLPSFAQLDALAPRLRALLAPQPGFEAILSQRLRDSLPAAYTHLPADAFYLNQARLPDVIAQRLAGAAPLASAAGEYATPTGLAPLPAGVTAALLHFIERFQASARAFWLDAADRFWRQPRHGETPTEGLQQWLRAQWAAQLQLRQRDTTLPAQHCALAQAAFDGSPQWRAVLRLETPHVRLVLPGACVLAAGNPLATPGLPVLLTTFTWGMEAFANWRTLHDELAERLEDDIQGPALLACLAEGDRNLALASRALIAEAFTASLFTQLATSLIERQRNAAQQAWQPAAAADFRTFAAQLDASRDLQPLLSIEPLLHTHYVHLLEQRMPAWLKGLNEAEMLTLNIAKNDLWVATLASQAEGLLSLQAFNTPTAHTDYAYRVLARLLRRAGVALSPRKVFIITVAARPIGPLLSPVNPAETGYSAANSRERAGDTVELVRTTRSLLALAMENLSLLDKDYWITAQVRDEHGKAIPGLGPFAVRRMVRQANVGGSYQAYLQHQLRSGPEANWRRGVYGELLRCKMRYEGYKAAYRQQLSPSRELHPWIDALTHQGDSRAAQVGRHPVHARQLLLRAASVHGVYLFCAIALEQAQAVLLYAPGNPNRQHWTLFDSRQHLASTWLNRADVREYLIQRTAMAEHAPLRKAAGSHAFTSLVSDQPINGRFFANAYRSETRLLMANADALSTSNEELDRATLADLAMTLIEVLSMGLPARATAAASLGRAIWSLVQFFQELDETDGKYPYPLGHIVGFSTHILEGTVALSTSPIMSKVLRRLSYRSVVPVPTSLAAARHSRFLKYKLESESQGQVVEQQTLLEGHSEYYIEDTSGRRYEVLFDGEHWRIVDGRKPDTLYKPVIKQNSEGIWEMVDLPLWRGAYPNVAAMLERVSLPAPAGLSEVTPAATGGRLYIVLGARMVEVRASLLGGRYTVVIAPQRASAAPLTLKLRRSPAGKGWEAKARQNAMSSPWVGVRL